MEIQSVRDDLSELAFDFVPLMGDLRFDAALLGKEIDDVMDNTIIELRRKSIALHGKAMAMELIKAEARLITSDTEKRRLKLLAQANELQWLHKMCDQITNSIASRLKMINKLQN